MMKDLSMLDNVRLAQSFMSVEAMLALNERGVTVLDPFSTLVSEAVGARKLRGPRSIASTLVRYALQCIGSRERITFGYSASSRSRGVRAWDSSPALRRHSACANCAR
jgi:hypothetical protein